ncbi:beta-galactosidase-like [Periplaneta americana]|uniref:beta-galactosidase-like n=1 Tax=Periplaneta americana TaxID=6978 RepID=UPI0037E99C26
MSASGSVMDGGRYASCCRLILLLLAFVDISLSVATVEVDRSFRIDYDNNQFLLDGAPFRYVSGSLHYFRLPRAYWRDRLRKMRAAGLNAVSTYVEWSQHEPEPNVFNFSGELDLPYFIQVAQEEDLLVLLRPGPYICAEREMGGLPSWLLNKNPDMKLRSNDSTYMEYVERYLNHLMTVVQPQLYGNGGPIIMVQIENEYGSYEACDKNYTAQLRDIVSSFVNDAAVLYTTDGGAVGYLRCGKVPGVYATVDFGSGGDVNAAFAAQRIYEPRGPYVNSEFYPGWLTHWGENLQTVGADGIVKTLEEMLTVNASVNFYMFFGGTNFGFMAGANYGDKYQPQLTSYDYDAPLTEAGDLTDKYSAIREAIGKFLPLPNITVTASAPKGDYGTISLAPVASLLDLSVREGLGTYPVRDLFPQTFEALNQQYGFVLYETIVTEPATDPALFSIPDISDRGTVLVNNVPKGILSRADKITSLPISVQVDSRIQVLVENQGRINYGSKINDFKGFISNATLGTKVVEDWTMTGFPLNDISAISNMSTANSNFTFSAPAFFKGTFTLPLSDSTPLDTYLDPTGWGKGVAFINGFNLGRYWPVLGPQVTLYVPGCYLKPAPEVNELILFELELAPAPHYNVTFVTQAYLNKVPPTSNAHHRSGHSMDMGTQQLNQGPAPEMEREHVSVVLT